jgi:uncharacterized SAM-binding protein YcdF (DUF218 family)
MSPGSGIGRFIAGFALGALVMVLLGIGGLITVGHTLRVEDPLARVDAIVAISGDTGPRVRAAVALWNDGYAGTLIFAGGAQDPASPSSAEIMKRQAIALGVPDRAILVETESETTDQNAERVALLMKEAGLKSAILVTSAFHQRRASMHFAREFERYGLTFRNRPADDPSWDPTLWWTKQASRTITFVELAKIAVEAFDGRFDKPTRATASP